MPSRVWIATVVTICIASPSFAQSVILVRHAERADTAAGGPPTMAADPDLSEAGRERARRLADMLKDSGITAIYVTEFARTRQTAAPLAVALGVTPTVIRAADTAVLVQRLRAATGHVLVVGHSNTVPDVAAALTSSAPITMEDDEYDNLLVVPLGRSPRLLRLRY
ncbi:MAG: histidine phosphatase family protein [Acidobacteriota bacterium]|nr:histidine phosphatase family protein [Acidobacteriota bacterium]